MACAVHKPILTQEHDMEIGDAKHIVDTQPFLDDPSSRASVTMCRRLAQIVLSTSALVFRDPRVHQADCDALLDLMEAYYALPMAEKRKHEIRDGHQAGFHPPGLETPRDNTRVIAGLGAADKPHPVTGSDPKERFFVPLGDPTNFSNPSLERLNPDGIIPAQFSDWKRTTETYGQQLQAANNAVLQMLAIGLDLPRNYFVKFTTGAPHLLSPSATDLATHRTIGTVMNGFHYDLCLSTCHGRARFRALWIWLRSGLKQLVLVPEGCLLWQAGMQLQILTAELQEAQRIMAGFHEVVVTEETLEDVRAAEADRRSLWRVSPTFFEACRSDLPITFSGSNARALRRRYPWDTFGDQVTHELRQIGLIPA